MSAISKHPSFCAGLSITVKMCDTSEMLGKAKIFRKGKNWYVSKLNLTKIFCLRDFFILTLDYRLSFKHKGALILVIWLEWYWMKWSQEAFCAQKDPTFSLYPTHQPNWTNFEWKWTLTLAVVSLTPFQILRYKKIFKKSIKILFSFSLFRARICIFWRRERRIC